MSIRITFFFLLMLRVVCPAADADALLAKGNQLYAEDKFAEAKTSYEQALTEGPRASVLYNGVFPRRTPATKAEPPGW